MRKTKMSLIVLALLWLAAAQACLADGTLPEAVLALCARVHPGYAVAMSDGWGDASSGQFALLLQGNGGSVLCVAEKTAQDADYALTVDNPHALPVGCEMTSLVIDTGGDSLFYGYADGHGLRETTSVHASKENGAWGAVDVTAYCWDGETIWSIQSFLRGSRLCYTRWDEDAEGNVLGSTVLSPMDVNDAFARGMRLNDFDADRYDPDPTLGMSDDMIDWLNEANVLNNVGSRLVAVDISARCRAELMDTAAGRVVCISDWDGETLVPVQVLGTRPDAEIDAYHAGDSAVLIDNGDMFYTVSRAQTGRWVLNGIDPQTQREVGPDWVNPNELATNGRNDHYVYGTTWWSSFAPGHIDLPQTVDEAMARMDTSAYALVNNPNPGDRLHLRERADKGARSLGKFYNRTPVQVLQKGDTWTRVRIGLGEYSLTGYMMTKYLAFTEQAKAGVGCAFPQMALRDVFSAQGVPLYRAPDAAQGEIGMFRYDRGDFLIGVVGEEWYVVLCADGSVGYVLQYMFWPGNG